MSDTTDAPATSPEPTFMSIPMETIAQTVARIQAQNALSDIHRLFQREVAQRTTVYVHTRDLPPAAAPALDACFHYLADKTSDAIKAVYSKVAEKEPDTIALLNAHAENCDNGRDWALRLQQTLEEEGLAILSAPLPTIADEALGLIPVSSSDERAEIIEQITTHVTDAFQAALSNTVGMATEIIPICNPHDAEESFDLALQALTIAQEIIAPDQPTVRIKNPRIKDFLDSLEFTLRTPLIDINRALKSENQGFLAGEILSRSGYLAPLDTLTATAPQCDVPKGGMLCELHATLSAVKHNLLEDRMFMWVSGRNDQTVASSTDDPAYKAARRVCQWRLENALAQIEDMLLDVSEVSAAGRARLKTLTPDQRLPAPFVLQ